MAFQRVYENAAWVRVEVLKFSGNVSQVFVTVVKDNTVTVRRHDYVSAASMSRLWYVLGRKVIQYSDLRVQTVEGMSGIEQTQWEWVEQ